LIRGLEGRVHVAFEEGTQAQWLHDVLEPQAERVIVCNIRGRGETANKSDPLDADRGGRGVSVSRCRAWD